jgi:hypothetical protein
MNLSLKLPHRQATGAPMPHRGADQAVSASLCKRTRGLTVHAELDPGAYPKGTKIPDREIKALETTGVLTRHAWHGEWNYTLCPENARVED